MLFFGRIYRLFSAPVHRAAAGYIVWDEQTHEIGQRPRFEEIEPFLELVQTHSERLPDGWV